MSDSNTGMKRAPEVLSLSLFFFFFFWETSGRRKEQAKSITTTDRHHSSCAKVQSWEQAKIAGEGSRRYRKHRNSEAC
ncbi:hypothetical protein BDV11DRAFT_125406 [Aspergillus similis]